jgi:hypothetical protein
VTLSEAKAYLGTSWVLHRNYQPQPNHSSYALVNVGITHMRVRDRLRRQRSFAGEVEHVRQRLRLIHGRVAA